MTLEANDGRSQSENNNNNSKVMTPPSQDAVADKTSPPAWVGITFGSGDFVSLFSLFFDNLSSVLGLAGAILGLSPGNALLEEIVYERIVPAMGFMLFLGNVYYSYQAIRMTKKHGRPFTAQPYGINSSGGFPFV